jgi:hypothetical protein
MISEEKIGESIERIRGKLMVRKERPILFSAPMVKAILEGRKTQTRRVLKSPDPCCYDPRPFPKQYEVGMRLWVRETWTRGRANFEPKDGATWKAKNGSTGPYLYRANQYANDKEITWRPCIFMPRDASRITLEIVNVRVERIQEISHDDVLCEGTPLEGQFSPRKQQLTIPQIVFSHRWDALNGKRGFGWDKNPWVWVVEFKRMEKSNG